MKNKIGWLKITICAAFLTVFGAAFLLAPAAKIAAVQPESGTASNAENPQSCAACHRQEYFSQHYAAHHKNVRRATVENVRGDFTNENRLAAANFEAAMFADAENFYIKLGEESYKIAWVVGVKYVEQYVAEKNSEFYSLPIGYDLTEKRWVHLNDTDFAAKNASASRHLQKWKTDCAACHQPSAPEFSEDQKDFGISCNACHGDSAAHLAAKNSVWARLGFQTENKIVNPRRLSSDAALLMCAGCHSRDLNEAAQYTDFRPDDKPLEIVSAHGRDTLDAERFWANGESKFSGNEFQAIARSVCYAQSKAGGHGITGAKINCASCHSEQPSNGEFTAAAGKSNDQNRISCHAQFSDEAAIVEHSKHPPNAADCASCHQPETVYGRMRFVPTHEISVPDPSLTIERNIPNACNLCHIDQSANWAVRASGKLWAERFRDHRTSSAAAAAPFDQPEAVRLLASNEPFLQALATHSIKKHSASNHIAPLLRGTLQTEPLIRHFLAGVVEPKRRRDGR